MSHSHPSDWFDRVLFCDVNVGVRLCQPACKICFEADKSLLKLVINPCLELFIYLAQSPCSSPRLCAIRYIHLCLHGVAFISNFKTREQWLPFGNETPGWKKRCGLIWWGCACETLADPLFPHLTDAQLSFSPPDKSNAELWGYNVSAIKPAVAAGAPRRCCQYPLALDVVFNLEVNIDHTCTHTHTPLTNT